MNSPRASALVVLAPVMAALVTASSVARAQVVEGWAVPIALNDLPPKIVVDSAGRTALAQTVGAGPQGRDVNLVVRDPVGTLAWSVTYHLLGDETVADLAASPDGGFVVAILSDDLVNTFAGHLVKYDASGNLAWDLDLGPNFQAWRVVVGATGAVTVAGQSVLPSTNHDVIVTHCDVNGLVQWTNTGDAGAVNDQPLGLTVSSTGAVGVCGTASTTSGSDSFVLKFEANGALAWARTLAGPGAGYEQASSVSFDANGDLYAVGFARVSPSGGDGYVWKLDALGNTAWIDYVTGPPAWTIAVAVDVRGDVQSVTHTSNASVTSYVLRKHDASGNRLWERTRTAAAVLGLVLDGAGEALVFGTDSNVTAQEPFVTRYDRDGVERWTRRRAHTGQVGEAFQVGAVDPTDGLSLVMRGSLPGELVRWRPTATAFCFGDGSGTACPCGNASPIGDRRGCANSFSSGARLVDLGSASLSNDTLGLRVAQVTNSFVTFFESPAVFAGGAGVVFGDGLRCVGGPTTRVATRLATNGMCTYPSGVDAPLSVAGSVTGPGLIHYQVIYRDTAPYCTGATFNTTGALRVEWTP